MSNNNGDMNYNIISMLEILDVKRLKLMVNARDWVYSNKANEVRFTFDMCEKANTCHMIYNEGMDLFTLKFFKFNKKTWDLNEVKTFNELYIENIHSTFRSFTGLETRVPKIIYAEL